MTYIPVRSMPLKRVVMTDHFLSSIWSAFRECKGNGNIRSAKEKLGPVVAHKGRVAATLS
jgi:hypothetical protein